MKKKIVYISGADVFDVNDVRAAFDEVRSTLNLDSDTILFGVPVDDAVAVNTSAVSKNESPNVVDTVVESEQNVVPEAFIATETDETDTESVQEIDVVEKITEAPKIVAKPARKPRKAKTAIESVTSTETVTPILSVLSSQSDEEASVTEEQIDVVENIEMVDMQVDNEEESPDTIDVQNEDISEMIKDDIITPSSEIALEELFDKITPLREDVHPEQDLESTVPQESSEDCNAEIDATLENLASEFADAQAKMPQQKKSSERGKIGKLKNILPFKKMKRDDTGLMGDLFGWAGIAANDEEFTIPGFFTNAAAKK